MSKELTSFRGFYIFKNTGEIAFSQKFSTVEARVAKKLPKIPSNKILANFFEQNVIKSVSYNTRYSYKIDKSVILCVIPIKFFYLAVIPLVSEETESISASLYFLSFIRTMLKSSLSSLTPTSPLIDFSPLKQIINLIMPFGTPILYDQCMISQLTNSKTKLTAFNEGLQNVGSQNIPSWKETLTFLNDQLEFIINEAVLGSISQEGKTFKVFGELRVNAYLSSLPVVSVSLSQPQRMCNVQKHFSVKSFNDGKLVFIPATGTSQILTWEVPVDTNEMPFDGEYSFNVDGSTLEYNICITLKDYTDNFTVVLPFDNCGKLLSHNFETKAGKIEENGECTNISFDIDSTTAKDIKIKGSLNFDSNITDENFRAIISFGSKNRTFTNNKLIEEQIEISTKKKVMTSTEYAFTSEKNYFIKTSKHGIVCNE